jgi:hypothetical protein
MFDEGDRTLSARALGDTPGDAPPQMSVMARRRMLALLRQRWAEHSEMVPMRLTEPLDAEGRMTIQQFAMMYVASHHQRRR